ncbi:hypothetical protein ACW9HW_02025 [Pseudomonas sp. SDO5532_S415]
MASIWSGWAPISRLVDQRCRGEGDFNVSSLRQVNDLEQSRYVGDAAIAFSAKSYQPCNDRLGHKDPSPFVRRHVVRFWFAV